MRSTPSPRASLIRWIDSGNPTWPTIVPSAIPARKASGLVPTPWLRMTVGPNGLRSFTRDASIRSTVWLPAVRVTTSRSSTRPGLTPTPTIETPLATASMSSSAAMSGLCAATSASSSAIDTTLIPARRILRRSASWSRAHEVVAIITTSTSARSSTDAGSLVTTTSSRRPSPSTSPRSRPRRSGRESTAATSRKPGFSSARLAIPEPIAPNPHCRTRTCLMGLSPHRSGEGSIGPVGRAASAQHRDGPGRHRDVVRLVISLGSSTVSRSLRPPEV